jgi:hypothetical protein
MSKTKQTTQQNQNYGNTATYGQITPQDTADVTAYRNYRPEIDPSIAYGASNARNRLNSSFINPLGGNYSAQMQDKLKAAGNREIDQGASQAFRLGQYDVNQQRQGQLGSLAALTAPRIVQTGSSGSSTGTGSSETGKNTFGNVLDVAQAGAGMAMM